MNSRRLTITLLRTAAFLVFGIIIFATTEWSWFAGVTVALLAGAVAIQLGGVLWLRRAEKAAPSHDSASEQAHGHGN